MVNFTNLKYDLLSGRKTIEVYRGLFDLRTNSGKLGTPSP